MAPEIPSQFSFETLLSHTFPGFFLALGVFMLLDLLITSYDLTLWALGDFGNFLKVLGFIILVGTILGILIDGIQHTLEKVIFENCQKFKDLDAERKKLYPASNIKHFYYYTREKEAFRHLKDNYYCYAEFYGNIAISLIALSFIAPFYFRNILNINNWESFILGCLVPLVLAGFCIWSSYETFLKYHRFRIDLIYGILRVTKSIQFTKKEKHATVDVPVEITAQLKEWTLVGLDLEDLEAEDCKKIEKSMKNGDLNNLKILSEVLKKKYKVWKANEVPPDDVEIIFETSGEYLSVTKPNKNETNGNSRRFDFRSILTAFLKLWPASTPPKTTNGKEIIQKKTTNANLGVWFKSDESGDFTVTASSEGFISGNVVVNVEKTEEDKNKGKKKENAP
jgi:hypothetical protein